MKEVNDFLINKNFIIKKIGYVDVVCTNYNKDVISIDEMLQSELKTINKIVLCKKDTIPLSLDCDFKKEKKLLIDYEWYKKNKKYMYPLLCYIIQNMKIKGNSNLLDCIDKSLLNRSTIECLCKNKNLKHIPSNVNVYLDESNWYCIDEVLNTLNDLKKKNKIIVKVSDKIKFNKFILNQNLNYNNIFVSLNNFSSFMFSDWKPILLKKYLKYERLLYLMIEPALNLSIFEKYIYAYNITKNFKEYKKEGKNESGSISRNLYDIINSEYMVCAGYANLFSDLLEKLDIPNEILIIKYDSSKFNIDDVEKKQIQSGQHARVYSYIVDKKYGIDGFYVSDPTWDSCLHSDYYNYLVMTDRETTYSEEYLMLDIYNENELFNVNNLYEFYKKINFVKNKTIYAFNDIIKKLINKIKKLDNKFYYFLTKKYIYIENSKWPNDTSNLIFDLGVYIVDHVNKEISGNTIFSAVEQVYKKSYGYNEEKMQKKLIEIRQLNKERQEIVFPKRYKEYEDGKKEIYDNQINKFDTVDISNKTI